jgi:hypothetical protein
MFRSGFDRLHSIINAGLSGQQTLSPAFPAADTCRRYYMTCLCPVDTVWPLKKRP